MFVGRKILQQTTVLYTQTRMACSKSQGKQIFVTFLFSILLCTLICILGFRMAVLQLTVTDDKSANVANALKRIQKAKSQGCTLAILPECFNSPYNTGTITINVNFLFKFCFIYIIHLIK